jgi:hypothetical protein
MHYHISGISLRLRDPVRDVGALLERWGFEVGRSWVAGEPRTTPGGTALEGVWPDSYAYSSLPADGITLAHRLLLILRIVEPIAEDLADFADSGGAAELFVGWHFQRNSGDRLDWELLRRLADCRLSLSLDIYPEPEPEPEEFSDA